MKKYEIYRNNVFQCIMEQNSIYVFENGSTISINSKGEAFLNNPYLGFNNYLWSVKEVKEPKRIRERPLP